MESTGGSLRTLCAWPVSSQYGPGSRFLYYTVVAICLFNPQSKWASKASLAAALLAQAIAAIHAIVLAAVHRDGAIDMDVYGILQVCSIGALASPWTAKLSVKAFNESGMHSIYVWLCIIVSGLLSLAVELFRSDSIACRYDDQGAPTTYTLFEFPYGTANCGVVCNPDEGPFSPIRRGSADNINIIPMPYIISPGMGLLLAVGSCIPAVAVCVSVFIYIRHVREYEIVSDTESQDQAELPHKARISTLAHRLFNHDHQLALLGAAVVAMIVGGEVNLFSAPVQYDVEPMSNVGQWAPIALPALALSRSLYLRVADAVEKELRRGRERLLRGEDEGSDIEDNRSSSDGGHTRSTRMFARAVIAIGERMEDRSRHSHLEPEPLRYPAIPGEMHRNPQFAHTQVYHDRNVEASTTRRSMDTLEVPSIFRMSVSRSSYRARRAANTDAASAASNPRSRSAQGQRVGERISPISTEASTGDVQRGPTIVVSLVDEAAALTYPDTSPSEQISAVSGEHAHSV